MQVTRNHALEIVLQNSIFPVFVRLVLHCHFTGNQYSITFSVHSYRESCSGLRWLKVLTKEKINPFYTNLLPSFTAVCIKREQGGFV